MDDQLNEWGKVKWLWLAALVVSEAIGVLAAARSGGVWFGLGVAGIILVLFLCLFGAYYFWRRTRARSWRRSFSAVIQAQATLAPRSVSDPNQRAALDRLRQKFQAGLNEFTSRGRDIYKLPWYVIIGEPGSGKSEAIRHSGIDFPPGLQNELQGSGGTVNMDWWFTNQGVILDTAGRLLFSETPAGQAPEWSEFLRLLKKARAHCPINGLFIVLSVESLIKDSSDKIAQKASRMAQQLDLIQRVLDVRFPVYLLVSKCDLLTGFRDFFESVDDPLLQHQMFGWSNPDPLDAPFRPDLVEGHLQSVADRVRRRRLWLLRESFARRLGQPVAAYHSSYESGGVTSTAHRAEEAESLFALPESIMRLAPRLRRYLEKIFVTGEWSAKPVFLRGIYFTSSMREGKALDEAIAMATGLPLDQLPEDEGWEKDRAFFLRDMFLEKVFREHGLVTRANNTRKLLQHRLLTLYGTSAAGLAFLLALALFGYHSLNGSIRREAAYWKYGADRWNTSAAEIVSPPNDQSHSRYSGNDRMDCQVPWLETRPTQVEYHAFLATQVTRPLTAGLLFKPLGWFHSQEVPQREPAQRALLKKWVVKPLVLQTRLKMTRSNALAAEPGAIARHRDALLALLQLEADGLVAGSGHGSVSNAKAEEYLRAFVSYLTDSPFKPDPDLARVMVATFAPDRPQADWPPEDLLYGQTLVSNPALTSGLDNYRAANLQAQTNIFRQLAALDLFVDSLSSYAQRESLWLKSSAGSCAALQSTLLPLHTNVAASWEQLRALIDSPSDRTLDLKASYSNLQTAASAASASSLLVPVNQMVNDLPKGTGPGTLFQQVRTLLERWQSQAAGLVRDRYQARETAVPTLQRDGLALVQTRPAFEARWELYTAVCALGSASPVQGPADSAARLAELENKLLLYDGPLSDDVMNVCNRILAAAKQTKLPPPKSK